MRKYLILSVLTLVMLFVIGNNAYAATINADKMYVKVPSRFEEYYNSVDDDSIYIEYKGKYSDDTVWLYFNYNDENYDWKYGDDEKEYTKADMEEKASSIDERDYESDYGKTVYTILSKSLIKIGGVNAIKIRHKDDFFADNGYVITWYYEQYYIRTDDVTYNFYIQTKNSEYYNTDEWKNMINSIVIKDTVKETRVTPFTDVQTTAWYYEAVKYCYTNNYINGKNSYTFGSNDKITRGMLVTILYGMEGAPKVTATNKFSDVASNKYYYNAVRWASSKGIVNGSNGKFRPDDNVTRQDLAVILSAYCNYKGKYVKTNYGLTSFSDSSNVSSYALTAVKWAVKNKIISGTNGKLNPKGNATRAEAATMIYSFCLKFK